MLNGEIELDKKLIEELREQLTSLKQEYIKIVGGNDIPIYFGKIPDALQ